LLTKLYEEIGYILMRQECTWPGLMDDCRDSDCAWPGTVHNKVESHRSNIKHNIIHIARIVYADIGAVVSVKLTSAALQRTVTSPLVALTASICRRMRALMTLLKCMQRCIAIVRPSQPRFVSK